MNCDKPVRFEYGYDDDDDDDDGKEEEEERSFDNSRTCPASIGSINDRPL